MIGFTAVALLGDTVSFVGFAHDANHLKAHMASGFVEIPGVRFVFTRYTSSGSTEPILLTSLHDIAECKW